MDSTDDAPTKPLRVVPRGETTKLRSPRPAKTATPTTQTKKPDFVIPYPEDLSKGKVDMQGAFRFYKPADAFEWANRTWAHSENRMVAYVYRQVPVCNFAQSNTEPNPDLGHNISKWEAWPFPTNDYHVGMLEKFGAGIYMILWMDPYAGRKIAKIEDWELNNYENYPPKIRIDDVVVDSIKNRSFLAWARNAGCLFPNDKGYEAGKFVHIETQRHRKGNDDEEEYMTKGPIGQALENVTGRILNQAVDNMMTPPPPAPPAAVNPAIASLDHMAAVAAVDLVKETNRDMNAQKAGEQSALLGLVVTMVNDRSKPDNSQADGFKFAIDAIQKMADMQIAAANRERDNFAARLDRIERQERQAVAVATAPPKDPQEEVLAYLDRQEAIMQRLGYSRRGGGGNTVVEAPPNKDLLQTITDALPELFKAGMQMYSQHMSIQLRMAELAATQKGMPITITPIQQPAAAPAPPPTAQAQPAQPPNTDQGGTPATPTEIINEAMRQEVGGDFDVYVANFHMELAKFDRVICAKYIEGMKAIIDENAEGLDDQIDIMSDHGALFAEWYKQIPGNGHSIMVSYKTILIDVLKTYKPIWDVFAKGPAQMQQAFIEGFCDPSRLDEEEDETKKEAVQ